MMILLLAEATLEAGCKSAPYAAADNRPLAEESTHYKAVLNSHDQSRIEAGFGTLSQDHQAVAPPRPALFGVRWTDVPQATLFACDDAEMAVVRTLERPWGYEFHLLTIENFPGRLLVRRTDNKLVYEAEATIGLYGDHVARARELLEAFDQQMRAFGKKRAFDP